MCVVFSNLVNKSHCWGMGLGRRAAGHLMLTLNLHTKMPVEYMCELLEQVNFGTTSDVIGFGLWLEIFQREEVILLVKFHLSKHQIEMFLNYLTLIWCKSFLSTHKMLAYKHGLFSKILPYSRLYNYNIPDHNLNSKVYIMAYNSLFVSCKSFVIP